MYRYVILALAFLGIGAATVASLPSFNRSTDVGKTLKLGPRGALTYSTPGDGFNVVDFGADPTGVADSLAAFKLALARASGNYCESGGTCSENVLMCTVDNDCTTGRCYAGLCGVDAGSVYVPRGVYKLSDTLHIRQLVTLQGDGPRNTILRPAVGKTGIIVQYYLTSPSGLGSGQWSTIKGIGLEPQSDVSAWVTLTPYALGSYVRPTANTGAGFVYKVTTAGTSGGSEPVWPTTLATTVSNGSAVFTAEYDAGIWLRTGAHVEDVFIGWIRYNVGFGGHGIQVVADTTDTPPANANGWSATRMLIQGNRGSCVYTLGGDANRGQFSDSTTSGCQGYGVYDSGFLGNTYTNITSQSCVLGGYWSGNGVARSSFFNCYSESDEPASKVLFPSLVFGGLYANDFTTDSTAARFYQWDGHDGGMSGDLDIEEGNSSIGYVHTQLGINGDPYTIQTYGAKSPTGAPRGDGLYFKYMHDSYGTGNFRWDIANSDSLIAMMIATSAQSTYDRGTAIMPSGVAIGASNLHWSTSPLVRAGPVSALPATCRANGDLFLNSAEVGPLAWKCTPTNIWHSVGRGISTTTAAAGNSQGTAAAIAATYDSWRVTGADGTKGVTLPAGPTGFCTSLFSTAATNALVVWPNTGDTIDGAAANASVTQAAQTSLRYCLKSNATDWLRD